MNDYDATKMPPIDSWRLPRPTDPQSLPAVFFESREHYDAVCAMLELGANVDSEIRKESLRVDKIARGCHEVNRAYCLALGDDSQLPWDDALPWQRESARNGVTAILDGTVLTAEDAHKSWMKEKEADGWVWGPKKDPANKEHPCMVLYATLPKEQQAKDALFHATVAGMR